MVVDCVRVFVNFKNGGICGVDAHGVTFHAGELMLLMRANADAQRIDMSQSLEEVVHRREGAVSNATRRCTELGNTERCS